MSHFFFCIKEYTIKQGSNGLSFSLGNTMVVLFGDFFVVLFGDLFVVFYTIYIMTFAPLIGVSFNVVFGVFGVTNDVLGDT
jgi:hypothetical protein